MNSPALDPFWKLALASIRANFAPGLVLWCVAVAVVMVYYLIPDARSVFNTVGQWKSTAGFGYSIVSTGLFAGLLPWLFLRAMPATRPAATGSALAFMAFFWAYRGLEIDALYRLQGLMFGTVPTLGVVSAKVAFDLFVYNVVWATSLQLLAYHWKDSGFRVSAFRDYPWRDHFMHRLPAAVLSTWAVWLPVLISVYSLPADLQIPLFNLAACFWALVMATLTKPAAR